MSISGEKFGRAGPPAKDCGEVLVKGYGVVHDGLGPQEPAGLSGGRGIGQNMQRSAGRNS